jgi:WD40 repeat protein
VWDAATGQVVAGPFTRHTSSVNSVAFLQDGQHVASASSDGMICVWDVATGQVTAGPFSGHTSHTSWVNSVAFSLDGQHIASASVDCNIRVWDVATGQVIAGPFTGHTGPVSSVAFSPDGQRIASASLDRTIRMWDVATGQVKVCPFTGHTESVRSVASQDGPHFTDQSFINGDGWIYHDGPRGEKEFFLWIPDLHRRCLHRPSTVWVAGEHETRLDLSKCVHGLNWASICHDVYNVS